MTQARVNVDEINEQTGFSRAEEHVWNAFAAGYLAARERDGDVDAWVDNFCEQAERDGVPLERNFVKSVCVLGMYAGPRDEFQQRSGCGKAVYPNGDRYEGDFFEGKRHGCGRYMFASARKSEADKLVEAEVKRAYGGSAPSGDDEAIGRMAEKLALGRHIVAAIAEYGYHPYYHGDYVHGKRCGQGIFKHKDATVYKGDFRDNKRDGQGVYYYLNGDVYSGSWRNGRKHGYGAYRFADGGGEYRGEWADGVLLQGQWIMSNGTYYEGKFDRKNRPLDDSATMHFPSIAMTQCGAFRRGIWSPTSALYKCDELPVDATAWAE